MRVRAATAVIVAALAGGGCRSTPGAADVSADSARLAARGARLAQNLIRSDSDQYRGQPVARWIMPSSLSEISGLTLTSDQRLFAHGDERAAISQIDYRRGIIVKQFLVGKEHTLRGDFEGLTIAGDKMFLLASNGELFEFKEGGPGQRVDYVRHDTRLGKECEFEGIAYDPATASLLLSCKHVYTKEFKNELVIYRWKIDQASDSSLSTITVPFVQAAGANGWTQITPSDITVDPFTGNYVLIASHQRALIEITPTGEVVMSRSLPGSHDMAEGVAITRDSILIVSDEAVKRAAVVTLYRWP